MNIVASPGNRGLCRFSICFFVILIFSLSGCYKKDVSSSPEKSSSTNTATESDWKDFTDQGARAFVDNCQHDYLDVQRRFLIFEQRQTPYQTAELLNSINQMDIVIDRAVSKASLYSNVHPNSEVRSAAEICEQKFVELLSEISLSQPLYTHIKNIDTTNLNDIDARYVKHMLRDFRRSGVDKDKKTRNKIKQLNDEINLIGQNFDKNIRDSVLSLQLDSIEQLKGLPDDFIAAHKPDAQGKITVTTSYPDYIPIMQYAHNDRLRFDLYKLFNQRAYPENEKVLQELLKKRYELAQLLGYTNYANYITEDKMIQSPANAHAFINKVSAIAAPLAQSEYQTLLKRLQKIDPKATEVGAWQKSYLEQLIKEEQYGVDSKIIRQYFSYDNVRQGIFDLTQTMFGVQIKPWVTDVWHESVKGYEIWDGDKVIGRFYLDMHPRDGKYSHAAAFTVQDGVRDVQLPIAALVCNFPGGDGTLGLMEHSDVETFLHEFGHLLHAIFAGNQPWLSFSGFKTEWDFVEAPSQMLEEWVWDADTLATFARNENEEIIPPSLIEKMISGREFGRALWVKQQLFYAALSLNIYDRAPQGVNVRELMIEAQNTYAPFNHVDDTFMYTSFGHLNGYSAIYYTYMWSLAISTDMFSEFEKYGMRNADVAQRYRQYVLAPGGSKDAKDLISDFLGRPYDFASFAKYLNRAQN